MDAALTHANDAAETLAHAGGIDERARADAVACLVSVAVVLRHVRGLAKMQPKGHGRKPFVKRK